jgi:choline-sulfatase
MEGPSGGGNHSIGGSFKQAGPSGIPEFQMTDSMITHEAVKFLQLHRALNQEQPLLLSIHYPKPHFPYKPPVRWFDAYKEVVKGKVFPMNKEEMIDCLPVHRHHWEHYLGYGASQDEMDCALAGYAGNVSYVDECVGHVLNSLRHARRVFVRPWGDGRSPRTMAQATFLRRIGSHPVNF